MNGFAHQVHAQAPGSHAWVATMNLHVVQFVQQHGTNQDRDALREVSCGSARASAVYGGKTVSRRRRLRFKSRSLIGTPVNPESLAVTGSSTYRPAIEFPWVPVVYGRTRISDHREGPHNHAMFAT